MLKFIDEAERPVEEIPAGDFHEAKEHLTRLKAELKEYFEGTRKIFSVPLDLQGTEFQKKVWNGLHEIPFGHTQTYHDQARKYGDIKAIRATASANGKNKIVIVVPCHRVVGQDGSLTGYSGGLWRKKWLLEWERGGTVSGDLFSA